MLVDIAVLRGARLAVNAVVHMISRLPPEAIRRLAVLRRRGGEPGEAPGGCSRRRGQDVISVALALARNGLSAALATAAWNGGAHVAPTFAGDTLRAFTEVVERASRRDVGALRLRLSAVKNVTPAELPMVPSLLSGTKDPRLVLELDYWALFPRR
jgi:hypothetical protein